MLEFVFVLEIVFVLEFVFVFEFEFDLVFVSVSFSYLALFRKHKLCFLYLIFLP